MYSVCPSCVCKPVWNNSRKRSHLVNVSKTLLVSRTALPRPTKGIQDGFTLSRAKLHAAQSVVEAMFCVHSYVYAC